MTSTRDTFAAYLQAAIDAAGLRVQDLPALTNGVVKVGTIYRWLRLEGDEEGELSTKRLRAVAEVLNVPPMEMFVAAGVVTPQEAGFEGKPPPPPAPDTLEERIMADTGFTDEKKETLVALTRLLREERNTSRKS